MYYILIMDLSSQSDVTKPYRICILHIVPNFYLLEDKVKGRISINYQARMVNHYKATHSRGTKLYAHVLFGLHLLSISQG